VPDFTEKSIEEMLTECLRLAVKINNSEQAGDEKSVSPDKIYPQDFRDSGQIFYLCDCCQKAGFPKEEMTSIESGQLLCPECIKAFRQVVENTFNCNQVG